MLDNFSLAARGADEAAVGGLQETEPSYSTVLGAFVVAD